MRKSGTIYQSGSAPIGELRIALTEREKKNFRLMRFIGANISSLALAFLVFAYGPNFALGMNYQAGLYRASASRPQAVNDVSASPDTAPVTKEFSIAIASIGVSANVIEDVDPFDETEYLNALKLGVAHAKGTGKPGEGKRIFLFAHSTDSPLNFAEYNAVFYQLRLLKEGDSIEIRYNGDTILYSVTQKVVVEANDTDWLTGTSSEEELVLQTCDPPGTTLRRLIVVAKPVS